jgi:polar amino acid transport system permease protein
MKYQFDFSFLWDPDNAYWQDLAYGALLSAQLTLVALACGFIVGTLCAVGRTAGPGWLRWIIAVYVEIIRNTPLLVQTFWLFFGLASIGIKLPAFVAAVIALTINVGAYSSEIIRAGIESINKGQVEAAESLALTRVSTFIDVILPPAIEKVLPALASQFVLMMLASSIMAQISAEELMAAASRTQSETFRGFEIYIVVAGIYLVMSILLRFIILGLGWLAFPRRRRLARSG